MRVSCRTGAAVLAAALASAGLAGCAGVPVVVSAASLYVDSILLLRTEKTSTDHLLSAAMDRDCALTHVFTEGSFCKDAPPTPLLASVLREVQTVPPDRPAATAWPAPIEPIPNESIQVATSAPVILSDATPAADPAPLPARKRTAMPAAADAIPPTQTGALAHAALRAEHGRFLVVVGSFTKRSQAEEQRARFARSDADIVPATVRGRTYHRVVLPPAGKGDALREVALARSAGIKDAWLLPWSGHVTVETAVAALPMVGFLYRM